MVELTYTPEILGSRWIAANNPIPFKFTRKDGAIVSIAPYSGIGAGDIEVTLDAAYPVFVTDEYVYINSEDGLYDGNYKIVSPGNLSTIVLTGKVNGSSTGGYINFIDAYPDYFLQVDLQDKDGNSILEDFINYNASPKGLMVADFSLFLRALMTNTPEYEYSNINDIAIDFAVQFNFRYHQYYNGSFQAWSALQDHNFVAVNGAMQIGDATGQNMSPYVIFPNNEFLTPVEVIGDIGGTALGDEDDAMIQVDVTNTIGKFLTMFTKPKHFEGYPFSLSFLFDVSLKGFADYVCKGERHLDINSVPLLNLKTRLSEYDSDVNFMRLDETHSALTKIIKAFIVNTDTLDFNAYDQFKLNYALYSNVGTEKLYNYANAIVKTSYTFNRFTGEKTNVDISGEFITSTNWLTYAEGNVYDINDNLIATNGPYTIENLDPSTDVRWLSHGVYDSGISVFYVRSKILDITASHSAKWHALIGTSAFSNILTDDANAGIITDGRNLQRISKDIDGDDKGQYIFDLTNRYNNGTVNYTNNKLIYVQLVSGDKYLTPDLSTTSSDEINNFFAQVKTIDATNLKWYFFLCGNGGKLLRGVTVNTSISGGIDDPVEDAFDNIIEVSHGLTTENLRRVWFLNEDEGYIFGDNFTVLKTIDAGQTWEKIQVTVPAGYSTICYDGMVVKVGTEETYYFKCLNLTTNQYDILEFIGIGQFVTGEICSEEKEIEVDNECKANPIYLRWLNPLGGFDYWLFDKQQSVTLNVSDEITFNTVIDDMIGVRNRMQVLSKRASEEIEVGAEMLTIDQINGIKYLLSSPKVEMYNGTCTCWIEVRIDTENFLIYNTGEQKASINFVIIKRENFIQS